MKLSKLDFVIDVISMGVSFQDIHCSFRHTTSFKNFEHVQLSRMHTFWALDELN